MCATCLETRIAFNWLLVPVEDKYFMYMLIKVQSHLISEEEERYLSAGLLLATM